MSISENLKIVQEKIALEARKNNRNPEDIQLIAVSKTYPIAAILEAYQAGQRDFGENKVQEICQKAPILPPDIRWHLIGHLQTNKVKQVLPYISCIHSVDSERLIESIEKQAEKLNKNISILLQINISGENQKSGMEAQEAYELLSHIHLYPHIRVLGLMGIAEDTPNETVLRKQFSVLNQLKQNNLSLENEQIQLKELSMGMSGDYPIAIACGATQIRIGSAIFGYRNYP